MRIYVASSWRNARQPAVVGALRIAGHEVYDFRNPAPGNDGFRWSEIDPAWQDWSAASFRTALDHPVAVAGFNCDMDALRAADACVLVLPCGRSAHLELGWAVGAAKRTVVLLEGKNEPELMYRMVDALCADVPELLETLAGWGAKPLRRGPFGVPPHPRITTPCPSCGSESLFIGGGGHLTCAVLRCRQPGVASAIADRDAALEDALVTLIAIAAQPATAGRLWADNPTLGATLAHVRRALRKPDEPDPLAKHKRGDA